jgi:hypothetical protein
MIVNKQLNLFNSDIPPHQRHSPTSKASALKAIPRYKGNMARLLKLLIQRGSLGLTDEEGQHELNLDGNSYRPARVSLTKLGLVIDTQRTRKTSRNREAAVWAVTTFGIKEAKNYV